MVERDGPVSLSRQCELLVAVERPDQVWCADIRGQRTASRGVSSVERPDQVWCADITYIPVRAGFLYLVAVMDWATRFVLSWRLSNTMDAAFCVEALEDALGGGAAPGIFNTDQGAQFTSLAFTGRVLASGALCSMDGRGRCMDNVFIERLWRSLKYEAVYLRDLADSFEAEAERSCEHGRQLREACRTRL